MIVGPSLVVPAELVGLVAEALGEHRRRHPHANVHLIALEHEAKALALSVTSGHVDGTAGVTPAIAAADAEPQ